MQLAAILLNVKAATAMFSILIEMKTREGKTDMCAAVAGTASCSAHPELKQ